MNYIRYVHHGADVAVREDLKGTHREHCLCYACKKFVPFVPPVAGEPTRLNCPIALDTFMNCAKHNIVTPVFECPEFEEDKDKSVA